MSLTQTDMNKTAGQEVSYRNRMEMIQHIFKFKTAALS